MTFDYDETGEPYAVGMDKKRGRGKGEDVEKGREVSDIYIYIYL